MKPFAIEKPRSVLRRWIFSRLTLCVALSIHSAVAFGGTNDVYEWTFDGGNLSPALGNGLLQFADATTANVTTFGTTGGSVPHIGGQPASFMHVPIFNAKENGYWVTLRSSGPNGGGAYINQYTIVMDLFVPGSPDWTALFNTDPGNNNDADWYIAPDRSVGIQALGYTGINVFNPDTWYRLAFAADLGDGVVTYYLNGTQVFQRSGGSLLDGRFSLFSTNDNFPALLLFNEGDLGDNYTHELYLAGLTVVNRTLAASEVASLGGPNAEGIFVRHLHIARDATNVVVTWNGAPTLRLQRTTPTPQLEWQNAPGTFGASNFAQPTTVTDQRFFRLLWQ
jgi:hypothetical protein